MRNTNESAKNPITPVTVVGNIVQSDYYSYDLQKLNNVIDDIHDWEHLANLQLNYHKFFTMVVALQAKYDNLEDLKAIDVSFTINLIDSLFSCFKLIKKKVVLGSKI